MKKRITYQAIIGITLIIIGALFLLRTLEIYNTAFLLKFVPSLFITLGIWALFRSGFRNIAGPFIIVLVFGTIQIMTLDLVPSATLGNLWPLILVLIGVGFLVNRVRRPRSVGSGSGKVDLVSFFGGNESAVTSKSFQGGDITVLFGGVNLDLRDAELEKLPTEINTFVMFGGVDIKVPEEWSVEMEVLPLFGGASDDRMRSEKRRERKSDKSDLIVTGFATFGGVSVKD